MVAIRLADGTLQYVCDPGSRTGGQDEWSPRPTQALRFPSHAEAESRAANFSTDGAAKEYTAVIL